MNSSPYVVMNHFFLVGTLFGMSHTGTPIVQLVITKLSRPVLRMLLAAGAFYGDMGASRTSPWVIAAKVVRSFNRTSLVEIFGERYFHTAPWCCMFDWL